MKPADPAKRRSIPRRWKNSEDAADIGAVLAHGIRFIAPGATMWRSSALARPPLLIRRKLTVTDCGRGGSYQKSWLEDNRRASARRMCIGAKCLVLVVGRALPMSLVICLGPAARSATSSDHPALGASTQACSRSSRCTPCMPPIAPR